MDHVSENNYFRHCGSPMKASLVPLLVPRALTALVPHCVIWAEWGKSEDMTQLSLFIVGSDDKPGAQAGRFIQSYAFPMQSSVVWWNDLEPINCILSFLDLLNENTKRELYCFVWHNCIFAVSILLREDWAQHRKLVLPVLTSTLLW